MPLTPEQTAILHFKDFIKSNSIQQDTEKAIEDFSSFLVKFIQTEIKNADLVGVKTIVTGTSATGGPVTGTGEQVGGTGNLI